MHLIQNYSINQNISMQGYRQAKSPLTVLYRHTPDYNRFSNGYKNWSFSVEEFKKYLSNIIGKNGIIDESKLTTKDKNLITVVRKKNQEQYRYPNMLQTFDDLIQYFGGKGLVFREVKGKYNGIDATLGFLTFDKKAPAYIKTSAKTEQRAATILNLKEYISKDGEKIYYNETLDKNGMVLKRDAFSWDTKNKRMKRTFIPNVSNTRPINTPSNYELPYDKWFDKELMDSYNCYTNYGKPVPKGVIEELKARNILKDSELPSSI